MKQRLLIGVLLFFVLSGCATYPLPLIERDVYTNPEYGFSIRLPEGWRYEDQAPDWVRDHLPYGQARSVVVYLSNRESNGTIMISGAKFYDRFDTAEKLEEIRIELAKNSEKQKIASVNNPHKAYQYKLHRPIASIEPQIILNEIILLEKELLNLVIQGSTYIYLCEAANTCGLDIVLISDAQTFKDNDRVYQALLQSLAGSAP